MVTKTVEELDAMTREERKQHLADEEKTVFGHDVKHRGKQPLEKGIGAAGHETENHFKAIGRWEGPEAEKAAREAAKKKQKAA